MLRLRRLSVFVEAFSLLRSAAGHLAAISLSVDVLGALANAAMLAIAGRILSLLAAGTTWDDVLPWLIVAAVAAAVDLVAASVHSDLVELGAEHVESHAVSRVLDAAAAVPFESFDSPEFYDRLRRAHESGSEHAWSIVQSTLSLGRSVLDMVAIVILLAFVAPVLIGIVLLAYVPLWIVARLNNRAEYEFSWDETEADRRRSYIERLLSDRQPAKEVRLFAMQARLLGQYRLLWAGRLQHLHRIVRVAAARSVLAYLATSLVMTAALGVVVWLTIRGNLDLEQAAIGVLGVRQLGAGVSRTSNDMSAIHGSRQFLRDYEEFRNEAAARATTTDGPQAPSQIEQVTVEGLGFTYPGSASPALRGLDLKLRRGEVTAVVGANGSGESTLMHLLAGLYEPEHGRIMWDGVDATTFDSAARTEATAVLFQDFMQFHFTAADNVAFDDVDEARLGDALDLADAGDVIDSLDAGLDTQLGKDFDAGSELSIGQWQRLALARALYATSPLLLLDEPASALDPVAEQALVRRLKTELVDRCVVLVSHRFASVRHADQIIVLDEGRVIECGTHDELHEVGGAYAALFDAQTGV